MLPLELLRTRISRGKISPVFCSLSFGNGTDYELANKLVTHFENAKKENKSKGHLLEKISSLESEYNYKLVRGLFALLERRSSFKTTPSKINPFLARQKLFGESASRGFALSDLQRQQIVQTVAKQNSLSADDIESAMWNDLEDNLILAEFDAIRPKDLLLWYNLSLAQTLLFRCTHLEFYVEGGLYWKQVLRQVKRFGLMYNLERQELRQNHTKNAEVKENSDDGDSDAIKCILEGPLSLFKMTDRYGTSIAKLLPWIIKAPTWKMAGSIVRKSDAGSKIYQFAMSEKDTKGIIQPISDVLYPDTRNSSLGDEDSVYKNGNINNFDSALEAKFEKLFLQHYNKNDDWKISREPDPLIADGKAMIPDFLFERFGRRVYFEIVGFWTKEYIERKTTKLKTIFENNKNKKQLEKQQQDDYDKDTPNNNHYNEKEDRISIDLLVGVNSDLACSQLESISNEHVFTFKKEVPIKPVIQYLKKIDKEIIEAKSKTTKIDLEDQDTDIIQVERIARDHNIPAETALKVLSESHPEYIIVNNSLMVSEEKSNITREALAGVSKFVDACKILEEHRIPESCHADFLAKLGYDVTWNDLDPNNATLERKD